MSPWVVALAAIPLIIGIVAIKSFGSAALRRRHLRRLLDGRDPAAALATCVQAFSTVEPERVALAYLWVQQLVDLDQAPIRADDDLLRNLRIDQGDVDDQFESSHLWLGQPDESSVTAPEGPPRTVRDLVGEVLAYGYEGYSRV